MPFYEIVCIAVHYPQYQHIHGLIKASMKAVFDAGGVVRQLTSDGTKILPQRIRSHQAWHSYGDYWTMRFDASPKLMKTVTSSLTQDPRVIKWTVIKLGTKLEDILEPPSKTVRWRP
ncbi:hypothetical protein DACRYDRAFT_63860 [Dacryopinax primogenitus]|uniref:Ribosomal protein S6 n=1 Tax=Dacryopinax primogenitus (strain DJM 731) TaxID=1858805 RepID=M5G7U8_DACPD|nr:uncharacterized protein DACRYDRAFT_63860 [Dacryopinax primogenitus]EJU04205.1 hypothetical protein DACRYDRAFT_63860 [Dacryopinax primogenitus]